MTPMLTVPRGGGGEAGPRCLVRTLTPHSHTDLQTVLGPMLFGFPSPPHSPIGSLTQWPLTPYTKYPKPLFMPFGHLWPLATAGLLPAPPLLCWMSNPNPLWGVTCPHPQPLPPCRAFPRLCTLPTHLWHLSSSFSSHPPSFLTLNHLWAHCTDSLKPLPPAFPRDTSRSLYLLTWASPCLFHLGPGLHLHLPRVPAHPKLP